MFLITFQSLQVWRYWLPNQFIITVKINIYFLRIEIVLSPSISPNYDSISAWNLIIIPLIFRLLIQNTFTLWSWLVQINFTGTIKGFHLRWYTMLHAPMHHEEYSRQSRIWIIKLLLNVHYTVTELQISLCLCINQLCICTSSDNRWHKNQNKGSNYFGI
jgi:hypothetical protein